MQQTLEGSLLLISHWESGKPNCILCAWTAKRSDTKWGQSGREIGILQNKILCPETEIGHGHLSWDRTGQNGFI